VCVDKEVTADQTSTATAVRCQGAIPLHQRIPCLVPPRFQRQSSSPRTQTTPNRIKRNPAAPIRVKPRFPLTRNVLLGVLEVLEQRLVVPVNALVDVGGGVGETLDLAGLTAKETVEVGADLVGLAGADGVALGATGLTG
jgi:hypothetical protein